MESYPGLRFFFVTFFLHERRYTEMEMSKKIYQITDECCGCGSCAHFCEQEGICYLDGKYVIDTERCTGCGTCKEYCPIDDAIVETEEAHNLAIV